MLVIKKLNKSIDLLIKNDKGQATVEAAIMIPIVFILILLLLQPGILLYDMTIMNSAASETCRVLSTCRDFEKNNICDAFIRRRLGGIPQQDNFHRHSDFCSYEFSFEGDQNSPSVTVTVKNQVKPLPLIGFLSQAIGILNKDNFFEIEAKYTQKTKQDWVVNSKHDINVDYWVGEWLK